MCFLCTATREAIAADNECFSAQLYGVSNSYRHTSDFKIFTYFHLLYWFVNGGVVRFKLNDCQTIIGSWNVFWHFFVFFTLLVNLHQDVFRKAKSENGDKSSVSYSFQMPIQHTCVYILQYFVTVCHIVQAFHRKLFPSEIVQCMYCNCIWGVVIEYGNKRFVSFSHA